MKDSFLCPKSNFENIDSWKQQEYGVLNVGKIFTDKT